MHTSSGEGQRGEEEADSPLSREVLTLITAFLIFNISTIN